MWHCCSEKSGWCWCFWIKLRKTTTKPWPPVFLKRNPNQNLYLAAMLFPSYILYCFPTFPHSNGSHRFESSSNPPVVFLMVTFFHLPTAGLRKVSTNLGLQILQKKQKNMNKIQCMPSALSSNSSIADGFVIHLKKYTCPSLGGWTSKQKHSKIFETTNYNHFFPWKPAFEKKSEPTKYLLDELAFSLFKERLHYHHARPNLGHFVLQPARQKGKQLMRRADFGVKRKKWNPAKKEVKWKCWAFFGVILGVKAYNLPQKKCFFAYKGHQHAMFQDVLSERISASVTCMHSLASMLGTMEKYVLNGTSKGISPIFPWK